MKQDAGAPIGDEARARETQSLEPSKVAREAALLLSRLPCQPPLWQPAYPEQIAGGSYDSHPVVKFLAAFECETIERCAKVADTKASEMRLFQARMKTGSAIYQAFNEAAGASGEIAAAIRALSIAKEGPDNGQG